MKRGYMKLLALVLGILVVATAGCIGEKTTTTSSTQPTKTATPTQTKTVETTAKKEPVTLVVWFPQSLPAQDMKSFLDEIIKGFEEKYP